MWQEKAVYCDSDLKAFCHGWNREFSQNRDFSENTMFFRKNGFVLEHL